jgi:hypothetical protein
MTSLSETVLGQIRTRADLHRWSAANAHGRQMHEAVDLLERSLPVTNPTEAYAVAHAALASATKVIARADDSSGIIGDACRRLLALHPRLAEKAQVQPMRLVDWMIKFQFSGDVDYFEIDPVAYAPALGSTGIDTYRKRLNEERAKLDSPTSTSDDWSLPNRHEHFVLDWNDRRLAVLDRDIDEIIRTHARDQRVAAWLHDTAKAFEEIGEIDLAINWAHQASNHTPSHQALEAADYRCELLARHRPTETTQARFEVFSRWPTSTSAARLHAAAGETWNEYNNEVIRTLSSQPRDLVLFSLLTLQNPQLAWEQAHQTELVDTQVWEELVKAYETVDPAAVLPVYQRLVEHELANADAQHYRRAAKRLAKMRKLAAHTNHAEEIDVFIAELRETHKRRPRLQQEFDRQRLP